MNNIDYQVSFENMYEIHLRPTIRVTTLNISFPIFLYIYLFVLRAPG